MHFAFHFIFKAGIWISFCFFLSFAKLTKIKIYSFICSNIAHENAELKIVFFTTTRNTLENCANANSNTADKRVYYPHTFTTLTTLFTKFFVLKESLIRMLHLLLHRIYDIDALYTRCTRYICITGCPYSYFIQLFLNLISSFSTVITVVCKHVCEKYVHVKLITHCEKSLFPLKMIQPGNGLKYTNRNKHKADVVPLWAIKCEQQNFSKSIWVIFFLFYQNAFIVIHLYITWFQ